MKKNDISAFPEPYVKDPDLAIGHTKGMTLRDYFAGQAMNAALITPMTSSKNIGIEEASIACYKIADGMLKAREL